MILEQLRVDTTKGITTNVYIVVSKNEAIVIDPGGEPDKIIDKLNELNTNLKYIVLTHCHSDHIAAVTDLQKVKGGEVLISEEDGKAVNNPIRNLAPFMGSKLEKIKVDRFLSEGDKIKLGNDEFEIIIKVENRIGDSLVTLAEEHYKEGGNTDSYVYKEISIPYIQECNKYKATHIYILFKSGIETGYDYFLVPPYNNLSDGEYIGSQLYIDDVQLIYE